MGLISMKEIMQQAREGGYAVGYFESWDLQSLQAVIRAAEEENSPVIIGFNGGILDNADRVVGPDNLEYYAAMGHIAVKNTKVPVSFILNEVPLFELAVKGISLGFNAVMFEPESDDIDKNINMIRKLVTKAHDAGVSVEANFGQLPTADQHALRQRTVAHSLTDPEGARQFVEYTGIDLLGVSIGNVEVLMDGKALLDFDLFERIHDAVDIPLTLHGGSGIADGDIDELIKRGLCKMNLGTALNQAFLDGMDRAQRSSPQNVSPKYRIGSGLKEDILTGGEISMKELVRYKMKVYGSSGKAGST
jgi:ketose-bisphosphate aldolase